MNNDNFLIEESDLELARDICKAVSEPNIRNRAMANALAADIAKKYFEDVEVDTESGLHKIAYVLNELDISDIYVRGSYIDVRLYFENSVLCLPKKHFDKNILPVAYMFIKIDSELTNGSVTGFVLPNSINTENISGEYIIINEEDIVSFYDVEPLLIQNYSEDIPDNIEKMVFDYLDGRLEELDEFYKLLLNSKDARIYLKNAANVQNIFKFVSVTSPEENTSNELTEDFENTQLDFSQDIDLLDETINLTEESSSIDLLEENADVSLEEDISFDLNENENIENFENDTIEELPEIFIESNSDELELKFEEINGSEVDEILEQEDDLTFDNDIELHNDELSSEEDNSLSFNTDSNLEINNEFDDLQEIQEESEFATYSDSETINIIDNSFDESFSELELTETQDFTTSVTPSISSIENNVSIDDLENMLDSEDDVNKEEESDSISEAQFIEELPTEDAILPEETFDTEGLILENEPEMVDNEKLEEETEEEEEEETVEEDSSEQIEELFGNEENATDISDELAVPAKINSKMALPIIGTLTLVAALGYFGYTKFFSQSSLNTEVPNQAPTVVQQPIPTPQPTEDAMPVETVENISTPSVTEEGNAISIPAIEQNLDASILVSNLSINWEVPVEYSSNSSAKRYFTRLGKIIQLNLKSEMLLLSKPPVTNKIVLELEFDSNINKFNVKNIAVSSGENSIDELIKNTVQNALNIDLKTNTNIFKNVAGNPMLVIRL